jgi:hypothetical protein
MCRKLISFISFIMLLIAASSVQAFVIVTTGSGNGADTYLSNDSQGIPPGSGSIGGPAIVHGAEQMLEVRNYANTRMRIGYIRFDLTNIAPDTVNGHNWADIFQGAVLAFEVFSDALRSKWVGVYGLVNGPNDPWPEATICYNNAPGFLSASPGFYAVNEKLQRLGEIYLQGVEPFSIICTSNHDPVVQDGVAGSLNLDAFLSADKNKLVTFAVIYELNNTSADWWITTKEGVGNMIWTASGVNFWGTMAPTLWLPNAVPEEPPVVKWFPPFWFLNARLRLVWTPGYVTIPTGYWGGWYWWYYQNYWFYPWYGPVSWYWPYCYQYPYWAYWDYWPYYRYYHPWWHYWNWRGWPWFWGFNDRLTYWYWWRRPAIVYWWSYYWDPAGQGNCLELVTMSDEDNPTGGRILPLDPNVISHLEVESHQFSVNGGKVEGEFSQLEFIQTMHLEEYYRSIPDVNEDEVQAFINSDIVRELMKNDPCGTGQVGVQYAQWQHPVSPLTVSDTSIALPEGAEAQYSIGLRDPCQPGPVTVRVVSSKPEDLLIRCPDGSWDVESFFDIYYEMPQTVTVKAVDDTFSEGEETIMLANFLESDPNNGFPLAVTIQDDECGGRGYHEADLNHDCKVNFLDFATMADGWLSCTDPGQQD